MFKRISDYVDYHASRIPDTEALVLGDLRLSYRDLQSRVDRCASAMLAAGIVKGDRVATLDTPHPDFFVTFLAAASIGAIWIGLNPKYRLVEYRYVVADARPCLLFTRSRIDERDFTDDLMTLMNEFDCLETLVILNNDPVPDNAISFDDFCARSLDMVALATVRGEVLGNDTAMIVYTSGTTGKPKGAMIPHCGLSRVAHVQLGYWDASPIRALNFLPINHIGCVGDITCYTFVGGGPVVFMEKFDAADCLALIESEKITCWLSVPTAFQLCLAHPDFDQYDLSSIQLIVWGGASAPESLLRKLVEICPQLSTSYGQTESVGSLAFVRPCDDVELLSVSVGQPVPEYDVRIVDLNGNVVRSGETGEIQAKGDFIMRGYWNNPGATADTIKDGWLCTGDLAIEDKNGHYRLVGRLKEMYISGGYNVFPLEIEQVLESHLAVAMAAVVSVPDELFSEVGHAWILREPGVTVTADELSVFCRELLANYKVPKTIFIRDELPMLPIGKLDRQALKKESLKAVSDDKTSHGATAGKVVLDWTV